MRPHIAFSAAAILAVAFGPDIAAGQQADAGGSPADPLPRHVDLFATDQAFLRRTIRPRFEVIGDAFGDQYRESILLEWTMGRRFGVEAGASLVQFDAEFGGGASAFGGMEVTPKVSILEDAARHTAVSVASGFAAPIGDQDEWLSTHGWTWKPRLLFWQGWGSEGRNALQFEFGYDVTYDNQPTEDPVLVFQAGYSHWTRSNWIPILEITALQRLGQEETEGAIPTGPAGIRRPFSALRPATSVLRDTEALTESDRRLFAGTLGFRYALSDGQQWGAGFRFPVFGVTHSFRWGLIVGGTIRLP
jgi:hypothetical protein